VIVALSALIVMCSLSAVLVNEFFQWNQYRGNRERATQYLESHFNATIGLIYESELEGTSVLGKPYTKTFWLYSDNLLCYHAVKPFISTLADAVHSAYDDYSDTYAVPATGKLGALFGEDIPDQPRGTNSYIAVEAGEYVIGYDIADGGLMNDWRWYVDWLCYRAIDEWTYGNNTLAHQLVEEAIGMWDGRGFYDRPCQLGAFYHNYKLGLVLYTCHYVGFALGPLETEIEARMWSYQDPARGGMITLTDVNGVPVGSCNAEATAASLLPYTLTLTRSRFVESPLVVSIIVGSLVAVIIVIVILVKNR